MKKAVTLLFVVLTVSCVLLAGCGKSDSSGEYTGTWKAVSGSIMGKDTPIKELFDEDFIIELHEDGTAKVIYAESKDAKWSVTDSGVILSEGIDMEFKAEAGKLTSKFLDIEITLKKQP